MIYQYPDSIHLWPSFGQHTGDFEMRISSDRDDLIWAACTSWAFFSRRELQDQTHKAVDKVNKKDV